MCTKIIYQFSNDIYFSKLEIGNMQDIEIQRVQCLISENAIHIFCDSS